MGGVHGAFGLAADGEQVCYVIADLTSSHTHSLLSRLTNQAMQNHTSQLGVDDVALQKPQEVE